MPSQFKPKDIDRTIQANLAKLRKPGVLAVRPGFEVAHDQLTGKPAVVAIVHTKLSKAALAKSAVLPEKLGKYPVDVREATANQRLRAADPAAAVLAQSTAPPAQKEPVWPYEREMPSGKIMATAASDTAKAFAKSSATQAATHAALATQKAKLKIQYQPGADAPPLVRTEFKNVTITAVASPDAGYATLAKFLAAAKRSLTIGMYDFTSGPILKDFLADLASPKILQMVLDNPAPNPTRDQTDSQTVDQLNGALGARAKIARALVQSDVFAAEWMFPSAYHIKVIVRDGDTVWLSSGNLNNSNEPVLSSPPKTEDRDWHVILQSAELAALFTAYLNYDYQSAAAHQAAAPEAEDAAVIDAQAKQSAHANPPAAGAAAPLKSPVAAKTFPAADVFITPLLTPDTIAGGAGQYLANITNLINAAQESIYIQLQYIEASKGDGSDYERLLGTIAGAIARGLDVRLIESLEYGPKWAEKMKAAGVDLTANIRLQSSVHNKGFVIDHKTVVVSSQNFSPEGVQENRDAGLILESPGVAGYFEKIFLADWNHNPKPASAVTAVGAGTARGKKKAPPPAARKTA